MNEFCDTNILLRVLLGEEGHKYYARSVEVLKRGPVILNVVMAEVVFAFLLSYKRDLAYHNAKETGSLEEFSLNPKLYTGLFTPPGEWRKDAYKQFYMQWKQTIGNYKVSFQSFDVVKKALSIAIDTGYDWVDCVLLATHVLKGVAIASNDKDIVRYLDNEAKKLNLT